LEYLFINCLEKKVMSH